MPGHCETEKYLIYRQMSKKTASWYSMQFFSNQNFKDSFYDGTLVLMFGTLTGGMFLTGFALFL
jgi:hypothetical protein